MTDALSIRAKLLHQGGPALWQRFMDDLGREHPGDSAAPSRTGPTVREELRAAYAEVVKRERTVWPQTVG